MKGLKKFMKFSLVYNNMTNFQGKIQQTQCNIDSVSTNKN